MTENPSTLSLSGETPPSDEGGATQKISRTTPPPSPTEKAGMALLDETGEHEETEPHKQQFHSSTPPPAA